MTRYLPRSLLAQAGKHPSIQELDDNVRHAATVVALQAAISPKRLNGDTEAVPIAHQYLKALGTSPRMLMRTGIFEISDYSPGICTGAKLIPGIDFAFEPAPEGEVSPITGKSRRTPKAAVERNSKTGKRVEPVGYISPLQRVNIPALQDLLNTTASLEERRSAITIISSTLPDGLLCQTYVQGKTDRLFGVGGAHLQYAPKEVRRTAVGGLELDLVNCHPTIIAALGRDLDIDSPTIQRYTLDPKAFREEVADILGVSVDVAKRLLLSAVYGAKLDHSMADIMRDASADPKLLARCRPLTDYLKDVNRIGKQVINNSPRDRFTGGVVNSRGSVAASNNGFGKNLSHITQGIERTALDAMADVAEDPAVLEHDGLTVRDTDPDIERMESEVLKATGIALKVEVKHDSR